MISPKERYNLYKKFLKKFKPYYNVFFLANLIYWIMRDDQVFLNTEEIKQKWEEYLSKNKNPVLNFYIHIPFCRSKCSYCMYYSKPVKAQEELESYINRLISQINFFKNTFSNSEFSSLYIGGGTPSILSEKQITKLFSNLFSSFKFKEDGEKTFECNPESINLRKLKLLKKFGFNRVSFGVQNLDKKVLSFANRQYQDCELIKRTVKNAKSLRFEVNTDLMVGLKGESVKSIINSFIKLTKLQSDTITLYPLKPPDEYLKKYFNDDYYSFNVKLFKKAKKVRQILKSIGKKLNYNMFGRGFEIVTSAEPTFYSREFKTPYKTGYDYTSPLNFPKPCSLFALGTRANSYIFNCLQYYDAETGDETKDFNFQERIYWSMKFNLKDEMRYFILQQLSCRLVFSQEDFRNFFNSNFKNNFSNTINSLKKLGKIKFKGDLVFLPSNPLERFTCVLFFFDEIAVIDKIKKFFNKS